MFDYRALFLRSFEFHAAVFFPHRVVKLLPKYFAEVRILTEVRSEADHFICRVDVLHGAGLDKLLVESYDLCEDAQLVWLVGAFYDELV